MTLYLVVVLSCRLAVEVSVDNYPFLFFYVWRHDAEDDRGLRRGWLTLQLCMPDGASLLGSAEKVTPEITM